MIKNAEELITYFEKSVFTRNHTLFTTTSSGCKQSERNGDGQIHEFSFREN